MLVVNLILVITTIVSISAQDVVVSTKYGKVRGYAGETTRGQGKTVYYFRGIPFAEPPVGDLRFKPPVPKKAWQGILDVSQKKSECLQGSDPITGSEDCLYLKVYTTTRPNRRSKRPVMVWVYGGAFYSGSPDFNDHSPDYLLDEDVIVASFHYRLGIMGFLSTGDLTVPGNNGIKDQILALKWIKENIRYFGGDPDRITLFGQSAGGASISYLLQTNQTKGLFSKAIIQSGSSLSPWALSRNLPNVVKSIASNLGIDTKDSETMVAQLKLVNATELHTTSMSAMGLELLKNDPLQGLVFAPTIEPNHKDAVITGKSHELLSKGEFHQIPIMIGYTSLEAMFGKLSALIRLWLLKYDLKPSLVVPDDMGTSSVVRSIIGLSIRTKYFGILPISATGRRIMRFISDDQFERPIQEAIRLYSEKSPVYFYRFSYKGPLYGVQNRTVDGVGHTEDLGYIFDFGYEGSQTDYQTRSRMVKLWTNFVKYDNPTPREESLLENIQWPANHCGTEPLRALDIDKNLTIVEWPNKANMDYWNSLYRKYGRPPYDTY